jgi:phosphohistidine swiveling domain-containing protein
MSEPAPGHLPGEQADGWDPLHKPGRLVRHWTRDNVGEAAPGVLTPLSWTMWEPVGETALRRVAYTVGAFTREEATAAPPDGDRVCRVFYGRLAQSVESFAMFGDRMPGTSGREMAQGLLGEVPEDIEFRATKRRYPVIALRLPYTFAISGRRIRTLARSTDAWWREQIARVGALDESEARALFVSATRDFADVVVVHSIGLFSSVQPLYLALTGLVERTATGDVALLSGSGGAEMAIVGDIWKASRRRIGIEEVIANHGFHGPLEGELSSRVWREDPEPLRRLIEEYAARDDSADPFARAAVRRERAEQAHRALLAAVPRTQRLPAIALLRLAKARIPLRGVGKRSFLQVLDVARASARRLGDLLAADARLEDPEDVFYLTTNELTGALPDDVQELVRRRRQRREEYLALDIPGSWTGTPEPIDRAADATPGREDGTPVVTGVGVSAGVVEGTVRVVTDPSFAEVEPDEILVAPLTDPSWASIMFVSAALVVDIGGPMSHAAVVARELGLPCVVNTRSGTRELRTGDRVRVDGSAGTVEVLERSVGSRRVACVYVDP